jgi:hypothetical protein
MGQQQLLLLVLGIVIVGLAVVVGIEAFEENQHKAEIDRHTLAAVSMATEVIAWWQKPAALGGGGQTTDFSTLSLERLGYPVTSSNATRTTYDDGGYRRSLYRDNASMPRIHIHPNPWNVAGNTLIEVGVWGPHPECIVQRVGRVRETGSGWTFDGQTLANPDADRCTWL